MKEKIDCEELRNMFHKRLASRGYTKSDDERAMEQEEKDKKKK